MAADFDHISACGGNVEAQRCVVVLLGGERATVDVKERHRVLLRSLDHYLPAVGLNHSALKVQRFYK